MTRTGIITLSLALLAWPAALQAQSATVQVQAPPPAYQAQAPAPAQPAVVAPAQPAAGAGFVQAPPPGQGPLPQTEERVHVGMIVGGAVALGVTWLIHAVVISPFAGVNVCFGGCGASPSWESFRLLGLVPLLGPWMQLAAKPTDFSTDGWAPYLIVDGVLQAGSLALLIVGATVRETVTVYGDREGGGPYLALGASPGGLQLSGSF